MSGSEKHIFGVAEDNQFIKTMLDGVPALQDLYVRGELSNYKIYPSGHHYFTLKDPEGVLRCVSSVPVPRIFAFGRKTV